MVDLVQSAALVVLTVLVGVIGVQSVKMSLMVSGMVAAETDRRQRRAVRLAERVTAAPVDGETPGRALLRARILQRQREREARG